MKWLEHRFLNILFHTVTEPHHTWTLTCVLPQELEGHRSLHNLSCPNSKHKSPPLEISCGLWAPVSWTLSRQDCSAYSALPSPETRPARSPRLLNESIPNLGKSKGILENSFSAVATYLCPSSQMKNRGTLRLRESMVSKNNYLARISARLCKMCARFPRLHPAY